MENLESEAPKIDRGLPELSERRELRIGRDALGFYAAKELRQSARDAGFDIG